MTDLSTKPDSTTEGCASAWDSGEGLSEAFELMLCAGGRSQIVLDPNDAKHIKASNDWETAMLSVPAIRAALSPPSPDREAVIRECAAVVEKLDCSGNDDYSYGHDVALQKAEEAILALLDEGV